MCPAVDEGVGGTEGAVFHGFGHDAVHGFHFAGGWLAHPHAHCVRAQGARAQEGSYVGRDASFDHGFEPVAKTMPVSRAFPPVFGERSREGVGAANRCGCPCFTHDFGRDALGDFGETSTIAHQWDDGVALYVDKSGADDVTGRIDDFADAIVGDGPRRFDGGYFTVLKSDVAVEIGVASAVDDLS